MSSDNKALRALQKVAVRPAFLDDIAGIREKYDVPPDGFSSRAEIDAWDEKRNDEYRDVVMRSSKQFRTPPHGFPGGMRAWRKMHELDKNTTKKVFDDFDKDLLAVLKKYELRATLFPLLVDYIASNKIEYGDVPYYACAIDASDGPFQRQNENRWKEGGMRFVKLLISEDAEPADIQRFIKARWKEIRVHIRPLKKETARSKISKNWERDQLIYKLSRWSKADLVEELRQRSGELVEARKEVIIGKLIEKYGHTKLEYEAVKKVIERQLAARKYDK